MEATSYFAPTYFSPSYFAPLSFEAPPSVIPDSGSGFSDRTAYDFLTRLLEDTGEFGTIRFGEDLATLSNAPGDSPIVLITPEGWQETDDGDPPLTLRLVRFSLSLIARDTDGRARFGVIDRLACIIQNLFDGTSLNGCCLPALSKIHKGSFDQRTRPPELCLRLEGEFGYLIDATASQHACS